MRSIELGTYFNLRLTMTPLALLSHGVVALLAAWGGMAVLPLSIGPALLAGILIADMFFVCELAHQLGHAVAARRTGYPMTGIHWYSFFAASRYPKDEPELPPLWHIRRALGGFWVNMLIGAVLMPFAYYFWQSGGVLAWVLAVSAVYNFFIIGLGALLPIDIPGVFTIDGGTIWHYWQKMKEQG